MQVAITAVLSLLILHAAFVVFMRRKQLFLPCQYTKRPALIDVYKTKL